MPKFSSFDSVFGHNHNWTFNPFRRLVKSSSEPKQETSGTSPSSEPNKRKASDQDESEYKRVEQSLRDRSLSNENLIKTKQFKCPTEPFLETLRILDELF